MDGNAIPVSETTTVIVKASGDLFLQGEDQSEVRFQSSEDRIRVNQSNDTLYVETHASLDLSVPRRANVIVEKVGGSAFLEDLEAPLTVQKVGGDLALRRLASARIEKVGGGCMIEGVTDALAINKVGGDLKLRQVVGTVEVGTVGGEADIQVIGAGTFDLRAGGDIRVYYTENLSERAMLRAGGSIEIFVPSSINGRFILNSSGEEISVDLTRQEPALQKEYDTRRLEFELGQGGGLLEAQAGGEIRISDQEIEPESISEQLDRREEAWKEAGDRRGFPSWSAGFGFDRSSAWADMISRRAQEAARRAEQRAQAAVRRTEDQIRAAAEREVRRTEWRTGMTPPPPPHAAPSSQPVTEQERMMVLKMLQEQKISVEQAEKLLAALEGRFNQ